MFLHQMSYAIQVLWLEIPIQLNIINLQGEKKIKLSFYSMITILAISFKDKKRKEKVVQKNEQHNCFHLSK